MAHRYFYVSAAACQRTDPRILKAMNEDHHPIPDSELEAVAAMRDNEIFGQPRSLLDKTDNSRRNNPPPTFADSLIQRNLPQNA